MIVVVGDLVIGCRCGFVLLIVVATNCDLNVVCFVGLGAEGCCCGGCGCYCCHVVLSTKGQALGLLVGLAMDACVLVRLAVLPSLLVCH